jgi:hypothetical protein
MTSRVSKHTEIVAISGQPGSAEMKHSPLAFVQVFYAHVEVHLLWLLRGGPTRRLEIRRQLKRDPRSIWGITDNDPIRSVLHTNHPEQCLVERGQLLRVRAVHDESVPATNHRVILASARTR